MQWTSIWGRRTNSTFLVLRRDNACVLVCFSSADCSAILEASFGCPAAQDIEFPDQHLNEFVTANNDRKTSSTLPCSNRSDLTRSLPSLKTRLGSHPMSNRPHRIQAR